jgi:site-specific recombinase XerD
MNWTSVMTTATMKRNTQKKSSLLNKEHYEEAVKYYKYLKGKRYSEQTIRTYGSMMADFLLYLGVRPISEISHRLVEKYCEDVIVRRQLSISYQRQFIGALKLFTVLFGLSQVDPGNLKRPKKQRMLPVVLSPEEVMEILRCTRNLKHRTAIAMLYSAGLRISELINLKLSDVDITRRQIRVKQSKGRRDRYIVLSESFLVLYSNYMSTYEPKFYFMEGSYGSQYSTTSIRKVLQRSCARAKIKKKVTPHTLRHSYATHLLENGIDIRYIQELLGHRKPETTMIYTHVQRKDLVKIKSPLDIIVEKITKITEPENPDRIDIPRNDQS